jgi:hypothetical protein
MILAIMVCSAELSGYGFAASGERLAIGFHHLIALAREALDDAGQQHVRREGQVVGDGAEHDGIAEPDLAQIARDRHGIEGDDTAACGAHLAGRVFGVIEEAEFDHGRHQLGVVHQRQAVGPQIVRPAQRLGALEAEQHLHRARLDLRREHLAAEAQVRGHHAAALGHAGHFGFLDVVPFGDGRLGENLGGRHDALAADAADENVGDVVLAHGGRDQVLTIWIGMSRRGTC